MGTFMTFFSRVIDSSEMVCSLRYEDVRGCPYNMFTNRGIAALSLTSSLFAVVSLMVGA